MEKRYQIIKPAHGFYKGECLDTDIAPTIDTGVGCWHTLIGESMEEIKCEQAGTMGGGQREPKVMVVGNYSPSGHNASSIVDSKGIAPTVMENHGTVTAIAEPIIFDMYNKKQITNGICGTLTSNGNTSSTHCGTFGIIEPRICAMRGRNPDNPSDRTAGSPTEQRFEIGSSETSNTLTTVQKDNLVVEPTEEYIGCAVNPISKKLEFDGYKDGVCPALLATDYKCPKTVAFQNKQDYRIRKLTERECGRLMGVKGEDCKKLAKNQSTSSQYHLYGDAIVTACLMAIFGELLGVDYETKINELVEELKQ